MMPISVAIHDPCLSTLNHRMDQGIGHRLGTRGILRLERRLPSAAIGLWIIGQRITPYTI